MNSYGPPGWTAQPFTERIESIPEIIKAYPVGTRVVSTKTTPEQRLGKRNRTAWKPPIGNRGTIVDWDHSDVWENDSTFAVLWDSSGSRRLRYYATELGISIMRLSVLERLSEVEE